MIDGIDPSRLHSQQNSQFHDALTDAICDDWSNLDYALHNPSIVSPTQLSSIISKLKSDLEQLQNSQVPQDKQAYRDFSSLRSFLITPLNIDGNTVLLENATVQQLPSFTQYFAQYPSDLAQAEREIGNELAPYRH